MVTSAYVSHHYFSDEPAYLGCFHDNLPRDLEVYIPTHPATIGACVDTCKWQGFSVAALRNSDLCFCGNAYRKANQVPDAKCDMPCYDNSFEVCGGFMTFSQYWTGKTKSKTCDIKKILICKFSHFVDIRQSNVFYREFIVDVSILMYNAFIFSFLLVILCSIMKKCEK